MLQQTFARLRGLSLGTSQVICNEEHRFLAAEQVRKLEKGSIGLEEMVTASLEIVLEPMGRSTAPAALISGPAANGNGRRSLC